MPLLDLYIQKTGSNLNAGTDANDAASQTVTGGTVTNPSTGVCRFTSAAGTFSSGTWLNKWVSLSNNSSASGGADSVARFVSYVQTVAGDGSYIEMSNELASSAQNCLGKSTGTAFPTANAVDCRLGGAWAGFEVTGANGAMNAPATTNILNGSTYTGLRVNVKAGTYSYTSTLALPAGLTGRVIWWRGYYSTLTGTPSTNSYTSDLDNCANVSGSLINTSGATVTGATRPAIAMSGTNIGVTAGANTWLENLEFTNTNGILITINGIFRAHRCRFTGVAGNYALQAGSVSSYTQITGCYIGAGTSGGIGLYAGSCTLIGNTINLGGGSSQGIQVIAGTGATFAFNLFRGSATTQQGINPVGTAVLLNVTNNSFYNMGTGVTINGSASTVMNNVFVSCTNAISNASTLWHSNILNNDFYSCTNTIVNPYESTNGRNAVTSETGTPYVSTAAGDYSLNATAAARQAGFPGQFEV